MMIRWIKCISRLMEKCKNDHIGAFAAQTAFFLLLSLIPFLMVFSALLQYTPVTEGALLGLIRSLMPAYIAPFAISIVDEIYHKPIGIVSATAAAAVWSAARGVQHMAAGLNAIHGVQETRSWLTRRIWAVVYTAVLLLSIVAALVLLVFGNGIQQILAEQMPVFAHATELLFRLRSLLMLGAMSCVFTVFYKTLPNTKGAQGYRLTLRSQFPGAVLCAVIWYFCSVAISVYLEYFDGFSMYGSLTAVVLVMLWLYAGMYIMLLCAQINLLYFLRNSSA